MSEAGKKTNWDIHRYVCTRAHGPAPEKSVAAHSCDNKLCINPNHLSWESQAKNMADMAARGRAIGGGIYRQRLFEKERAEIRSSPLSAVKLGKLYGFEPSHIAKIRRVAQ